ncbi:uncharacterized protein LOC120532836 [Polypterus senegalus]|uniref:uncharacterized protein LOC120532836 n=1 Tax=Polypterus senegalus TaxID=55291 RepID=UPI001962EE7C|nr:uncharacterized protein LOC120532836 [Polypterus senegalus]
MFFIEGVHPVNLHAPVHNRSLKSIWEWTSHDSKFRNAHLCTLERLDDESTYSCHWSVNLQKNFDIEADGNLIIKPLFENAGIFIFKQVSTHEISLAMFEVYAFRFIPFIWNPVKLGSDVTRVCTISRVEDFMTVYWTHNGKATDGTEFRYKNTHFLILKNVEEKSQGKYTCVLKIDETTEFGVFNNITIESSEKQLDYTLYREKSAESKVQLLCRLPNSYSNASWSWKSVDSPESDLQLLASTGPNYSENVFHASHRNRFLSPGIIHSSHRFTMEIWHVNFEDAGIYVCNVDSHTYLRIKLITVEVSVSVGNMAGRTAAQLKCMLSGVSEAVRLTWMKEDGHTMVLVKDKNLTSDADRILSLVIPNISKVLQKWACVVFKENIPTAFFPLKLKESESNPNVSTHIMIAIGVVLCVIFIGIAISFFIKKKIDSNLDSDVCVENIYENVGWKEEMPLERLNSTKLPG